MFTQKKYYTYCYQNDIYRNENEMKWNIEENGNKNQYYRLLIYIINSWAVSLITLLKKKEIKFS